MSPKAWLQLITVINLATCPNPFAVSIVRANDKFYNRNSRIKMKALKLRFCIPYKDVHFTYLKDFETSLAQVSYCFIQIHLLLYQKSDFG